MNNKDARNPVFDKLDIAQLLVNWGTWRDAGNFEKLRSCYTDDARMITSWYDGPAVGFVDIVSQMHAKQPTDQGAMHLIGGTTTEINGNRAIAETRISILTRNLLKEQLVDITVHGRFIDFLRKNNGEWRIQSREPIYDKDFIQAVEPGLTIELDADELARQPLGFRHLAYAQVVKGLKVITTIPAPNSDEERLLYRKATEWLDAAGVEA